MNHLYYFIPLSLTLLFYRLILPEEDFGKILARNTLNLWQDSGISPEGLQLILRALYGEQSIEQASFMTHRLFSY